MASSSSIISRRRSVTRLIMRSRLTNISRATSQYVSIFSEVIGETSQELETAIPGLFDLHWELLDSVFDVGYRNGNELQDCCGSQDSQDFSDNRESQQVDFSWMQNEVKQLGFEEG